MSEFTVKCLSSSAELRGMAEVWDELWQRSEVTLPTARADLVALWGEAFATDHTLRALIVEDSAGRAVAALPLQLDRAHHQCRGHLGGNEWSPAGELLLDPHSNTDRVCDTLVAALREQPWELICCSAISRHTPHWQSFFRALERRGLAWADRPRCSINLLRIGNDWDTYLASRSASHRRSLRRALARSKKEGVTQLERHVTSTADEVEPLLRRCFEIEASGWKAATAVLHARQAYEFYLRQAEQLARWGQLSVNLLQHNGRPIAFEYGWISKRVYSSLKVGYDETFSDLTPGQLLRCHLIEEMFRTGDVAWFDFLGPAAPATSRWATDLYQVDVVEIALRGLRSRGRVAIRRHFGPLVRALRGQKTEDTLPITCNGPDFSPDVVDPHALATTTSTP